MINVNNKKTVYRLADSSFKANRMRNIFAVIAIVLTTVLFTGLFTIAGSLVSSMEESVMRQVGGSAHGGFKYLTEEQYDKLKQHPSIKEISYSVVLGTAENTALAKRPTELRYANDELEARMCFSEPEVGRLPEKEDELATDTLVLEALGIPAELGQKVTLEYSVCGEKHTETFELVGYWEGDIIMSASQVWLDRAYVEKILCQYDLSEEQIVGAINADFNFFNSRQIEKKILKVLKDCGYSADEIAYGVNWAYEGGNTQIDAETILGGVLVVFIIVFCGYLIISNVFRISVAKDVQFFGLLKTVGTTGKQIRLLLRRQTLRLCLFAIPIGLAAGCLIGAGLTPMILKGLNVNIVTVTLKPSVFLFAVLFSLITVFISIRKPSKLAARISPIEALRTSDGSQEVKKSGRKKSRGISLRNMAWGNVMRNKKKAVYVMISLSLSLVILNGAFSLVGGFDMDAYLERMISHDFVMGDVSCFNVYAEYYDQDTLSEAFIKELRQQEGVEALESVYFEERKFALHENWKTFAENGVEKLGLTADEIDQCKKEVASGSALMHIYGISDAVWEELTVLEGEIDLEKLHGGDYVVASAFPAYETEVRANVYQVGDKVEMFGKDGTSKTREVIAVASFPYNISIQHYHPVESDFFLPDDVFVEEVAEKCPMLLTMDVTDDVIDEMEEYLADYCSHIDLNMQYESRATYAAEYESSKRTYQIVGLVISALLALIGIVNFTNTCVTSVMTRKREMAMLQSIGMTKRQQTRMLISEGFIYTALTMLFTLTIGVVLEALGMGLLFGGSEYLRPTITVLPSLLCLPVLLLICGLIPYVCQRVIYHKSIVERLRDAEG